MLSDRSVDRSGDFPGELSVGSHQRGLMGNAYALELKQRQGIEQARAGVTIGKEREERRRKSNVVDVDRSCSSGKRAEQLSQLSPFFLF